MKKIENLELKELTLQEAKEVNGGFWLHVAALAAAIALSIFKLH
jgi:lactobin A/cerein 7B family class IIb bacteriocin